METIHFNLYQLLTAPSWFCFDNSCDCLLPSSVKQKHSLSVVIHFQVHMLQIKFFHKVGSMNAPVTDSEKLIWNVLEAERQTIRLYGAIVYFFSPFIVFWGGWCIQIFFFINLLFISNFLWQFFLCSQLQGNSLFEANNSFLEKHKGYTQHYHEHLLMKHIFQALLKWFLILFPSCLQILWCIELLMEKRCTFWIPTDGLRLSSWLKGQQITLCQGNGYSLRSTNTLK